MQYVRDKPAHAGPDDGQRGGDHVAHVVGGAVLVDDGQQVQHREIEYLVDLKVRIGEDGLPGRMRGNGVQIRFARDEMDGNDDAGHQHIGKPADDAVRPVFAIADEQRLRKQQHKPEGEHQPMDMLDGGNIVETGEQPEIGFEKP